MNEKKSAGSYSVLWDATNVGSGMYFCRLESNDRREVRRLWVDTFDQNSGFHSPNSMDLDLQGHVIIKGGGSMLGLGVGMIAAVLFTFFRDFRTIIQLVFMLVFFSSPILFKADLFQGSTVQAWMVKLHPITYFAGLFQKPIYSATWPSGTDWAVSFSVGIIMLVVGGLLMNKYKSDFYYHL